MIEEQRDCRPPFVLVFVFVFNTGLKVNAQSIARAIIPDKIRKHIANYKMFQKLSIDQGYLNLSQ